jgi:hypothetical protein
LNNKKKKDNPTIAKQQLEKDLHIYKQQKYSWYPSMCNKEVCASTKRTHKPPNGKTTIEQKEDKMLAQYKMT